MKKKGMKRRTVRTLLSLVLYVALRIFYNLIPFRIAIYVGIFLTVVAAAIIALNLFEQLDGIPERVVYMISYFNNVVLITTCLFFVREIKRYRYVSSVATVMILSVFLGVIFGIARLLKTWKHSTVGGRIGWFFSNALIGFIFVFTIFTHINFGFDFDPPKEYAVTIENVDLDLNGRKNPTTYQFTVTVEGATFEIDVPKGHYEYYEVGDTYRVYRYAGAFGKPFYIAEGFH